MSAIIYGSIGLVLFGYTLLLLGRFVWSILSSLNPYLRPKGWAVVVVETIYTLTDPPIKALNRLIPPVTLANITFRLSELLLFLVCSWSWPWFVGMSLRS